MLHEIHIVALHSSEFSDTIQLSTLGTIPPEPDPPMLSDKGVKHLTLSWIKRPSDETFTLQMNDESNYFRNKYTGPSLSYTVTELYRNTEYKFRVRRLPVGWLLICESLLFSYQHIIKKVRATILKSPYTKHRRIDPIHRQNQESKDTFKQPSVESLGVSSRATSTYSSL